ncbi:hypothetical protein APT95_08390 [Providencia stuartii]|nr:hypothetical protein APT95_08390 [Providencia stuartii]
MSLFRSLFMAQLVFHLDIVLPSNRPYVAPSAVVQARQRLGEDAVRKVFEKTSQLWLDKLPLSHWNGLTLMAVDGTLWRIPDPHYGYLMLHGLLRGEGRVQNRKRTYRLYIEEGLQVRTKKRKKLTQSKQPMEVPTAPN